MLEIIYNMNYVGVTGIFSYQYILCLNHKNKPHDKPHKVPVQQETF
jgi:hypothetical protein